MATTRDKLIGYSIFIFILILSSVFLSQFSINQWLHFLSPVLAVLASVKFLKYMSVLSVGLIVLLFTAVAPIAILFLMGVSANEPFEKHLTLVLMIQFLLPTIAALATFIILKRRFD
jgi:hypothetical protein